MTEWVNVIRQIALEVAFTTLYTLRDINAEAIEWLNEHQIGDSSEPGN